MQRVARIFMAPLHGFVRIRLLRTSIGSADHVWIGRKTPPQPCKSNPGKGAEAKVAFATGDRSWTEEFNVVTLAASALKQRGCTVRSEKTWLVHPDSDFILLPQIVELQPLDGGGVRTTTTMQTNHPRLAAQGLFEYQHSTGDNATDSIRSGFDQWAQADFPVLLDATRAKPETCMMLEMPFPAKDGAPARVRRVLLGPVMHLMSAPPAAPQENACETTGEGDEHPFCPCCLFTRSFEAFREFIEGDDLYGLRLYAARMDGVAQADCRVNGNDWETGAQALRNYVGTWPEAGLEVRKQYVVLRSS